MPTDGTGKAKVERKLAAILAADISGYSALMSADEEATVRALKAHQAVVLPLIKDHSGRVIDTAGDGILAEFASAVNAVKCAMVIQENMTMRNAAVDPHRRMQFRIGVNLGDVVFDDARVYGDGVNVAARLEAIAEPGGICISAKVHDEIRGKIEVQVNDMGPQHLKNIPEPVRVYRIDVEGLPAPVVAQNSSPRTEPSSGMPGMPSIAVLPFVNMGEDAAQDYFADGVVEDIITALSKFRWLFVIARNSSFAYKGRAIDVRQVARELNVRYVVEGSIRKSGSRLRITGQLIDAISGTHIWAQRYDRELLDAFEVQDEITDRIIAALAPEITVAEINRAHQKRPNNLDAWDGYLRALPLIREHIKEANYRATELLRGAIQLSPAFSAAYARLSACRTQAAYYEWDGTRDDCVAEAIELARRSLALDPEEPLALDALASAYQISGDLENAANSARRALDLSPTCTAAYGTLITSLAQLGQYEEAFEVFSRSERTSPRDPDRSSRLMGLTIAHFVAGNYRDAINTAKDYIALRPNWYGGYLHLAASSALSGNIDEANVAIQRLLHLMPQLTLSQMRKRLLMRRASDVEKLLEGLEKAGLPS